MSNSTRMSPWQRLSVNFQIRNLANVLSKIQAMIKMVSWWEMLLNYRWIGIDRPDNSHTWCSDLDIHVQRRLHLRQVTIFTTKTELRKIYSIRHFHPWVIGFKTNHRPVYWLWTDNVIWVAPWYLNGQTKVCLKACIRSASWHVKDAIIRCLHFSIWI